MPFLFRQATRYSSFHLYERFARVQPTFPSPTGVRVVVLRRMMCSGQGAAFSSLTMFFLQ